MLVSRPPVAQAWRGGENPAVGSTGGCDGRGMSPGEADEMIQHTKNAPKQMAWVRFCFPFIEWPPLLSVA